MCFLTKMKIDPKRWCNLLSIKQLRRTKIPKDNFTESLLCIFMVEKNLFGQSYGEVKNQEDLNTFLKIQDVRHDSVN